MLAPSDEERKLGADAQVASALGYASAASAEHSRVCGACSAEAAASESSELSVGGCPKRW